MKRFYILWFCSLIVGWPLFAQTQPTQLTTLTDVIQLAQAQSVAAKRANTQQRTNIWAYRSFLAQFKPQLSLDGSLPNFTRSYIQVTQPDGNIRFEPVSYNNSILNLSLSQTIAPTGGTIFVQKQIQRFDNFIQNNTLYNGIPFGIGLVQPLFQFNPMRWDKKIQPLLFAEGNQQLIESLEQVSLSATTLYFDLLVAQVNLQIAETNRANNDTLYRIALHKLDLGKISQNDLLQLQLSVLNAEKDLASARQTAAVASLKLKTFVGYRNENSGQSAPLELAIPNQIPVFEVDVKRAIDEAVANRSAAIAFRRRLLEAQRDLEKARKNNGLNATLTAGYGLSNQGPNFGDIYVRPQNREYVALQFTLPIMTWGRTQAIVETAKANRELAQQTVEQDKLTFEQEIFTQVTLLQMLRQQVTLTAKADQIGQSRYQIAQDRFKLSDLSVTDLGIATQEKDRARRDAILALRDYWQAYYTLRLLTLYDFESNLKIQVMDNVK
ncbi:TolC family protein [Spirosoma linguale]|uniref:Outer membrane protein-like protein n=1 Tax=Spirosoma linguale (strain ATCC 33905 / DSM 74 / LMG 10896 / Claus 1) TaxID=504472 RepID=D2QFJ8_SPILD|nr:Outer membrane protein-like protein [Spirosoma linguale DSM 74]